MAKLGKQDYVALASFRKALREFLRHSEQNARNTGITPQQYLVLLAVMGQEDRDWASINEIGEILKLKHNAIVGLVDRCQAAGLVTRSTHAADRRVVKVTLTDLGMATLERIAERNLPEIRSMEPIMLALKKVDPR